MKDARREMPKMLPNGWVQTRLGDVCLPVPSLRPEDSPSTEFTYFDIGGIDNRTNQISEPKMLLGRNAPGRARQAVQNGDILFSTVRTYLKNIARVDRDYPNPVASTGFTVLRPADGISSDFLFWQILSDDFLEPLSELQTGGSYPAVRDRDVLGQPIFLAPFQEQLRIVEKLNIALTGVERGETAARRAQSRIKHYRAAVLQAGVTGEMTSPWRRSAEARDAQTGQPTDARSSLIAEEPSESAVVLPPLPDSWTWTRVNRVGEVKLGRQRSPEHHSGENMRPYLRVANVFEARIDTSDVMQMNFTPREFETFHLRHGDILLNEGQSLELIGRPAMFRDEIRECCFQNTLVRFRASEAVNREYALLVFRSYLHNGQFQRIAKITTNLAHLGAERFAQMEFPLPPFDEQSEIVRLVEGRLSASDRLSSTLDQQISRAQETRQSLLRQAFQGQLVQQDAEDEPASVLLDRVQVIRALAAAKPKGKSMTRNRTKPHGTRRTLQEILSESDKPMTPEELFRAAGFEFSQVDQFYRELATLRISLTEQKPEDSEAKAWPHGSKVLLQLKKKAKQ